VKELQVAQSFKQHEERVKAKLPTGMLCACVLLAAAQMLAQEASQQPTTPQTPATQQAPPAQQAPPTQQAPPGPTPPSAPGTPPIPKPVVQMPSAPPPGTVKPPVSHEHDTGGDAFSIELFGWLSQTSPTIKGGQSTTVADPGDIHFPGSGKLAEGVIVTYPTTHENSLEFTYFQAGGQGNVGLGITENFFGNDFTAGDTVATNWHVKAMKLSWNYLTYPYPSDGAKFRVKTLWEVQYVGVNGSFDAPADVNAVSTQGGKSIVLPTFGLGGEYHPAKRLRLEVKASGFGILHHAVIWDGEASAVLRLGKIEALLGERLLHYKSSPKSDEFFNQTLGGPYVGLRWVFR
jgi:hypothetical protein